MRSIEPGIMMEMDSGLSPPGCLRCAIAHRRMTELNALRRADPIAVKAVGHAVAEVYQRHGTGFDVLGVEHREIAAILLRAPYR